MLGLPTHWIYLIDKNGNKENVANVDCVSLGDFKEEVAEIISEFSKTSDVSRYVKAQYVNNNDDVMVEITIKECLE